MLKWALVLSAVLLQCACSNRTEQAQKILQSHLGGKMELEFQSVEAFPGGAVCGEYRNNDPYRGSSRLRRFVVWSDKATARPSKQDWAIFCSEDPAAALQASYGIGPVSDEENHLAQVRSDMRQLQSALEQYRDDNFTLPTSVQGLAALVSASTTPPLPIGFRAGGYIESLPMDPWEHPYLYERPGLGGGVAQQFNLYTLGADGLPDGTGNNADVALEHLKYLDLLIPQ